MYFEEKRKKLSIEKNWKRAIKRAVIIGATVEILKEINQKVHLYGTSRNMMIKGQTRELAGGHRANSKVGGGHSPSRSSTPTAPAAGTGTPGSRCCSSTRPSSFPSAWPSKTPRLSPG